MVSNIFIAACFIIPIILFIRRNKKHKRKEIVQRLQREILFYGYK